MVNPVVEQCWQVRAKLAETFGGLDGLFDEMQRLDRQRLSGTKKKPKRAASTVKKRSVTKRSKSTKSN